MKARKVKYLVVMKRDGVERFREEFTNKKDAKKSYDSHLNFYYGGNRMNMNSTPSIDLVTL